ncbi:MAG TPA: hypothetical protein VHY19_02490 [Steroidobacteraceae bacterium]|nr:hypothetical protein [Steroidobacteraceae bacterium]
MKLDDIDPLLSRARDHLAMAIRLRDTAARLQTAPGKQRLGQLASLYEQLSLHFLEESRAASANRRSGPLGDDTIEFDMVEQESLQH